MGKEVGLDRPAAMASRWRRRRLCVLVADHPAPAALREISGRGAFVETNLRPPIGTPVELRHPDAGIITAYVRAIANDGITLSFPLSERSVAFALAAIAADMSRPPDPRPAQSTHCPRENPWT